MSGDTETRAVLAVLPAPTHPGLTLRQLAEGSGVDAWKVRCVLAVLNKIGPAVAGTAIEEAPHARGREPLFRRAAE